MNLKKSTAVLFCALLVGTAALAGCGNSDTNSSTISDVQAPPRVDTPDDAEINTNMTLTGSSYTSGDLTIKFPVVGEMDVPQQANPVNTMIQQDTIAIMDQYKDGKGEFDYQVVYNNGKILALRYTGTVTLPDAAYPTNAAFTSNINLETGERISSGAPEKAAEIAALLVSGEGFTVEGDEELQAAIITALKAMKAEDLTNSIAAADFGPDKKPTVFTSYAGDQKVIVSLPVEHALGDVAEITIDWNPPAPEPEETPEESPESKVSSEPTDPASEVPAQASPEESSAPASQA